MARELHEHQGTAWCFFMQPALLHCACSVILCLQSRIEEIGQALLRNTLLAAPDGLRRMQQGGVAGGSWRGDRGYTFPATWL